MTYPCVADAKVQLPATWMLVAITLGGGPMGILMGVPIASAAHALLKEATQSRGNVLRNEPQEAWLFQMLFY